MLFLRVTLLSCCCVFVHCIPSVSLFYPKTLTASTCSDQNSWTKWFNTVQPRSDKDFDQESFSTIQSRYGQDVCGAPCGMQARTVTPLQANASYEGSWKTSNGIISAFVSRTAGVDFQVRLCCASGQFVATTTAAPRPIPSKTCGRSKTKPSMSLSRISGGSRAVPHSWPWQVLYQEERRCNTATICVDTCGGTLIDAYHVLTAAHCIRDTNTTGIGITAGVHNRLNDPASTQLKRSLDAIFVHPDWNDETLENDLAILRLSKPVQFNDYVQPACLPGPDPAAKSETTIIGWGAERFEGQSSNELKQAQVKVIDDCQQHWSLFDEDTQICVGDLVSGASACQGDSGGPLLQEHGGQWVVQGVASFIDDCRTGAGSLPNVYVKVSAYLTWISSVIR